MGALTSVVRVRKNEVCVNYQLVIFDFDGTLADTFPFLLEVMDQLAETHRFRKTGPEDLEAMQGLSAKKVLQYLGIPWWKLGRVAKDFMRRMEENQHRINLFEGVRDLIARLHEAGLILAVVTSNSEANVRGILGEEVTRQISFFECGVSLFGKKPKFRRILKQSGIPAVNGLSIGDEIRDAEASRAAGLDFGAACWGYTQGDVLAAQQPAVLFRSVEEIGEFVLRR